MENLIALQLQIIHWVQSIGDWLTIPMEVLSLTATEYFYLLIAPSIYWCWDSRLGLKMGLFLMVNANLYSCLKLIFHTARPFWISTSLKHLAFESSFSLPSGHALNSTVFWGTLAVDYRKRWVWISTGILIFLVGLSRVYLAVHFPHDVLAGWLMGVLFLCLFLRIYPPITCWLKQRALPVQILVIFTFTLGLVLSGFLSKLAISNFQLPVEWVTNAASAFPEEDPINPFDISGLISNAGAFFGLATGACWLRFQGEFKVSGTPSQQLGRYILGMLGIVTIWFSLGELFPRGDTWLPLTLRFIRYGLVGLWVTALAPMVFIKLRLADWL